MVPTKITLVNRTGLAAVDAAQVEHNVHEVDFDEALVVCTTTEAGGAVSSSMRMGLEGSIDGSAWFELCRFVDNDALAGTVTRLARLQASGSAAPSEGALTATSLTTDEATGSAAAAMIPPFIRAATFFKTSGGGTPANSIKIEIVGRNRGGTK